MKSQRFFLFPTTIASSFILLLPALYGDAITWDADGGDNNWSTFSNWSDNAAPTGDDVTFDAAGALASGTTNTLSVSESIGSLSYSFEDADNQHTTEIAASKTLAVAGDFLLAGGATAADPTNVSITGSDGTLTVSGTSFQVGQMTPTIGTATNSLDMSGLGTLTANLGAAGTFRLGGDSILTAGALVTVKLAANSTITTGTLGIGDKAGRGGLQTLKLGSTSNIINANTLSVGSTDGRGSGDLSFDTGGTLLLRAADGAAAVTTMNMVNNDLNHSATHIATVDFTGHDVDAKIDALNMAIRLGTSPSSNSGSTATLSFDTGSLEVGTVTMATNGNPGLTGATVATIDIGGGTASFAQINMADSIGESTSTTQASLNLSGGTTTVAGNILRVGGFATTATVALKGGTLDMTGGNIGDATNPVTLSLQSGALKNVAQINGGGSITKTTVGSLTLSGANTFTGGVSVSTGEVIITESSSLGVGPKTLNPQANGYFTLDGSAGAITLSSNLSWTTAGLSLLNTAGDNVINGPISIITGNGTTTVTSDDGSLSLAGNIGSGATGNRTLELSGTSTGANSVSGAISNGTATVLITKSGAGTWALTNNANSFTGNVIVNDGELKITKSGALGTGTKNINFKLPGYLALDGSAGAITLSADKTLKTAGPVLLNIAGNNVVNSPIAIVGGAAYSLITSDAGSLDLAGGVSSDIDTVVYRRLELAGTSSGANTVSGPISDGKCRVDILKKGTGTWSLKNASNTYTGSTSVEEGILSVSTPNFDDASTVSIGTSGGPTAILNLPNAGIDTVATLSINGVVQPGGKTYGSASSVLPVIATSAITGPGTITVPAGPSTPYSDWADTFLPGNDVSDPAADNDKDGLVNQQEFAFGLNPISGSSVNPVLVQLDKEEGTFTYQRRAATGLTYKIFTSTTLAEGSWEEDNTAGQSPTQSGDNETVVVTLTGIKPLAATKLFVRVSAE